MHFFVASNFFHNLFQFFLFNLFSQFALFFYFAYCFLLIFLFQFFSFFFLLLLSFFFKFSFPNFLLCYCHQHCPDECFFMMCYRKKLCYRPWVGKLFRRMAMACVRHKAAVKVSFPISVVHAEVRLCSTMLSFFWPIKNIMYYVMVI